MSSLSSEPDGIGYTSFHALLPVNDESPTPFSSTCGSTCDSPSDSRKVRSERRAQHGALHRRASSRASAHHGAHPPLPESPQGETPSTSPYCEPGHHSTTLGMIRLGVNPFASTVVAPEGVPTTALRNGSAEAPSKEAMLTTALLPSTDDFSLNSSTPTLSPLVCIAVDDDAFLRIAHTIFFEHALGAVSD